MDYRNKLNTKKAKLQKHIYDITENKIIKQLET